MQVHIPLAIICVLLCLLPIKQQFRTNMILPVCIILITAYMAVRYDYGLDYWSYYNAFFSDSGRTEINEPLFWLFTKLFTKYYQFIAATSVLLMVSIYIWVKKFIPSQAYSLFFLCFMCMPGMCFTMMTALRTILAFVVMSWGLYHYYINKKNIVLYLLSVLVATMFHNSAVVFALVPFLGKLIERINPYFFFALFIVFSLFSFTGITQEISFSIFKTLSNLSFIDADYYINYADKYVSNINGAIGRATLLFPTFFICKYARVLKEKGFRQFYILTIIYFSIFFLSLDIDYRFTLYFFIFVIIALSMCLRKMSITAIIIAVLPLIVFCFFQFNNFYNLMRDEMFGDYSEGNFFIYDTIFNNLPLI